MKNPEQIRGKQISPAPLPGGYSCSSSPALQPLAGVDP